MYRQRDFEERESLSPDRNSRYENDPIYRNSRDRPLIRFIEAVRVVAANFASDEQNNRYRNEEKRLKNDTDNIARLATDLSNAIEDAGIGDFDDLETLLQRTRMSDRYWSVIWRRLQRHIFGLPYTIRRSQQTSNNHQSSAWIYAPKMRHVLDEIATTATSYSPPVTSPMRAVLNVRQDKNRDGTPNIKNKFLRAFWAELSGSCESEAMNDNILNAMIVVTEIVLSKQIIGDTQAKEIRKMLKRDCQKNSGRLTP